MHYQFSNNLAFFKLSHISSYELLKQIYEPPNHIYIYIKMFDTICCNDMLLFVDTRCTP